MSTIYLLLLLSDLTNAIYNTLSLLNLLLEINNIQILFLDIILLIKNSKSLLISLILEFYFLQLY